MKDFVHYFLHLGFPLIVAFSFFRKDWKKVYVILLLTMLVDLDHLLASPIFDPNRCSINFHPLHTYWAIGIYFLMLFFPKTRIMAIGLLMHMMTDQIDCWWNFGLN
ncbi:DUF6122 family protein [Moheibacter lacus]|uniref:LexA-binding, inner membrane-associated hydrolase n=1 Tax=Moheibacter lacus TaxID=2745851 RepID=A0A838ZLE4_9FLAO|nr:DUF6122 family protein [Moheibacter lacus]MBA5628346.1 hypothetical protein [Moheibacter lacus]